jgi:hypothetical protein
VQYPSTRIAWVESPLQFLNAVEYAHSTGEALHIIPRANVVQLADTIAAVANALPTNVTVAAPARKISGTLFMHSRCRLVGDAHSGQVRAALARGRVGDLVLVDDGSTALALMGQVAGRKALHRPGVPEPPVARALGAIVSRHLHKAARKGDLRLFTAYGDAKAASEMASLGARVMSNTYDWLRSIALDDALPGVRTVVVGSALVLDKWIQARPYLEWVASLSAPDSVYVAHRREDSDFLERVTATTGIRIIRPDIPIELLVATSESVRRIVTLPSSVVATLEHAVPAGLAIDVMPIGESWWMPGVDPAFRHLLDEVVAGRKRS